jgi:hypothetical protein
MNFVKSDIDENFVLDSYYPNYKKFLSYLENCQGKDYSWETTAFEAEQLPVWQTKELGRLPHKTFADDFRDAGFVRLLNDVCKLTEHELKNNGLDIKIKPQTSWFVNYKKGGWQSVHGHGIDTINQCLYFDDNPSMREGKDRKEQVYGSFYCLVGKEMRTIPPMPGRLITMKGSTLHGVYPVLYTPRRCLVIDYKVLN